MRIVVVGRDGQVSWAVSEALRKAGYEVAVLGRPQFDLTDTASVHSAIRAAEPALVVNAAAYTAVDRAEDEPDIAYAVNAAGAGAVAAAAAGIGVPIIHFSTDYVFDGQKAAAYVETDPTVPLGVYGRTKLEGERLVAAANPRHVILRTAWVCSPYGQNFVKTMLRLASERPRLRVVDDQRGNPTFADELANVVERLIPRMLGPDVPAGYFGIFHAVNSGETTWCGFARAIMDGAQARGAASVPVDAIATKDYPTKAKRPASSVMATAKLSSVHGIVLRQWAESLETCLDALIGPVR